MALHLLQKNPETTLKPKIKTKSQEGSDFVRIQCPHCKWQPKSIHMWMCSNCDAPEYFYHGCGMVWHTFKTKGKCPGCNYQWEYTKCLSCQQWSPHQDWYVNSKGLN